MEFSIKKAFKAGFSDEKWYYKWIFPFILTAVLSLFHPRAYGISKDFLLVLGILCIIPYLILTGFFLQFMHNEIKDELPLLPYLKDNLKKYLYNGFLISAAFAIYTVVFAVLFILFAILLHKLKLLFILAFIILIICYVALFLAAQACFADEFKFKDAFRFSKISKIFLNAPKEILIYIVFLIVFAIFGGIFNKIALQLPLVIIISAFISVFVQFTNINLVGQIYKVAKSKTEIPEKAE